MIPCTDVLDDIIGAIDPEDLPYKYIGMARVTDIHGDKQILSGAALTDFLDNPYQVAEVRIMVNVELIRSDITALINTVFAEVDKKLRAS